jgi:hypothetical protein
MGWSTAGTSKKLRLSRKNFKHAWQGADWKCIRRKPRSSTVWTGSAKVHIQTFNSTSSDTAFGPGWFDAPETTHFSAAKTAYIEPGSPWENGYIESFNARPRDELLNGEIFYTLHEAKCRPSSRIAWLQAIRTGGVHARIHRVAGSAPGPAPPATLAPPPALN